VRDLDADDARVWAEAADHLADPRREACNVAVVPGRRAVAKLELDEEPVGGEPIRESEVALDRGLALVPEQAVEPQDERSRARELVQGRQAAGHVLGLRGRG